MHGSESGVAMCLSTGLDLMHIIQVKPVNWFAVYTGKYLQCIILWAYGSEPICRDGPKQDGAPVNVLCVYMAISSLRNASSCLKVHQADYIELAPI